MEKLISVIIPVYNVEEYLTRCLSSVVENTYRNLEIICINDGSTDSCAQILEQYSKQDDRITVITTKNEGLSAARNKGLEAATGDYVAFIDSDDWIHPQYFERMISCYSKHQCDLVICDYSRPTELETFPELNQEVLLTSLLNLELIYGTGNLKGYVWGKLYPAGLVGDCRFLNKRGVIEDILFNAEIICGKPDISACYLQEKLYYYFDRADSLVHNISYDGMFQTAEAYQKLILKVHDLRVRRIVLNELIKLLLSMRYWMRKATKHPSLPKCNDMLKTAVIDYSALSNVSTKKKVIYRMMYHMPCVYSVGKHLIIFRNRRH